MRTKKLKDSKRTRALFLASVTLHMAILVPSFPSLAQEFRTSQGDSPRYNFTTETSTNLNTQVELDERIQKLLKQFEDSDKQVREEASNALAEIGDPAITTLAIAAKSDIVQVRLGVVETLQKISFTTANKSELFAILGELLRDSNQEVSHLALDVINQTPSLLIVGSVQERYFLIEDLFPVFIERLQGDDTYLQRGVLESLTEISLVNNYGLLRENTFNLVPLVSNFLNNPDLVLSCNAAQILVNLGVAQDEVIADLEQTANAQGSIECISEALNYLKSYQEVSNIKTKGPLKGDNELKRLVLRDAPVNEVLMGLGFDEENNIVVIENALFPGPTVTVDFDRATSNEIFNTLINLVNLEVKTINEIIVVRTKTQKPFHKRILNIFEVQDSVDFGTSERVPRLRLTNAPSREVLSLLARAAGSNLIYDAGISDPSSRSFPVENNLFIDVSNVSIQSLFNTIIEAGKFDATKEGRVVTVQPFVEEQDFFTQVFQWLRQNPLKGLGVIYIIFTPIVLFVIFLIRPLWLLRFSQFLEFSDIVLPPFLGGIKVSVKTLMLLSWLEYHPRVLDAWVDSNINLIRQRFGSKTTLRRQAVYIPLPVVLDGAVETEFSGKLLRSVFKEKRTCLLIYGEGGIGKTSLACKIAKWAMSERKGERPVSHMMIPILIEQELSQVAEYSFDKDEDILIEIIRGQLQALSDSSEPIRKELVDSLLKQGRILIIIDGLSEMGLESRKVVHPELPKFKINNLVVTSRVNERLGDIDKVRLSPLKIEGNYLSSFMESYLTKVGKRHLFSDPEYFDACRQLSSMVGASKATVLLARLFADQMIALKEQIDSRTLPKSTPELMLSYLNEINEKIEADPIEDRIIHNVVKSLSWGCIKEDFSPRSIDYEVAKSLITYKEPEKILAYLEERLKVIQTSKPRKTSLYFVIDPLVEYMAGLYLLESIDNEDSWKALFRELEIVVDGDVNIQGFLLALKDCCLTETVDSKVPTWVVEHLEELTAKVNL